MPLPPTTLARLAKLVDSAITPQHAERVRRIEQATNADGTVRGEQITGLVPARARWPIEPEQVAVPGFDYDTLQDLLDALNTAVSALGTTYLPIASPTFTGTLSGPTATVTTTFNSQGSSNLGNGDTDIATVQGHDRHKSAAPGIAVGVALGTGGSVGAVIAGSDQAGTIDLTAGTTSLTTGVLATITFASARPDQNYAPDIQARSANAGANAVQHWIFRDSASVWTIRCNVAPGSGNTLNFTYKIREYTN